MPSPGFRWDGSRLLLDLYVQPRAARSEFAGLHGDRIKLRIAAPPVDGEANKEVVAWLAKQFGVAKSRVRILSGETGKRKRVEVDEPGRLPEMFSNR